MKQKTISSVPATEADLQRQVIEYFKIKKYHWWRNAQQGFSAKGLSDLMLLKDGRFYAIELKSTSGRGRISEHQQAFIDNTNRNGGVGIVARSLREILEVIG